MQNVKIKRYTHPEQVGYQAVIMPDDGSWMLFLDCEGVPALWEKVIFPVDPDADPSDPETLTEEGYTPSIFCKPELLKAIVDGDCEGMASAMGCCKVPSEAR